MKGLFIPGITVEMFRNGCLESIETLMAEGEIYDIEYSKWIPVSERLPESDVDVLTQYSDYSMSVDFRTASSSGWFWADEDLPIAWMPLPKPYEPQESEVQ